MVLQTVPRFESSGADTATIEGIGFLMFLVFQLVVRDILHAHAAESANVSDVHVRPVDVKAQVQLQFEPLAAVVAREHRVHVAVLADLMILQPSRRLVLHLASGTLIKRDHLVRFLMFLQSEVGGVPSATLVAIVGFPVRFQNVLLHLVFVLETLLTEWTNVSQGFQYLIHLSLYSLRFPLLSLFFFLFPSFFKGIERYLFFPFSSFLLFFLTIHLRTFRFTRRQLSFGFLPR